MKASGPAGRAMVKATYSSGTPANGVGPGNAPAWACADAHAGAAARIVVASKAFDHGIICGPENNLVAGLCGTLPQATHAARRQYESVPGFGTMRPPATSNLAVDVHQGGLIPRSFA
jgi:hypothetical protein